MSKTGQRVLFAGGNIFLGWGRIGAIMREMGVELEEEGRLELQ